MSQMAFLFPGQGSQYVGMGQDLFEADPDARELFKLAEQATGLPLQKLCFTGPMEELTLTVNLGGAAGQGGGSRPRHRPAHPSAGPWRTPE